MVDAATGEGPLSKRTEGANEMFKKRYNVAASRARDQMWVVYSMNPESDLKPGDLRGELIKHAKDPQAIMRMLDTAAKETESEFEKQVLFRLRQAGYTVHPQWKVGGYRIDMVVEGGGKRVALECDGDKWHTPENLGEDMSRQAILERLGWRFVRLRGSEFFREPEKAMQRVFARLEYFEVFPENAQPESISRETQGEELKERVIRRAAELRQVWESEAGEIEPKELKKPKESQRLKETKIWITEPSGEIKPQAEAIRPIAIKAPLSEPTKIEPVGVGTAQPFELIAYLQAKGLEIVDNRKIGGTVWVIGSQELSPLMEKLRGQGFRFRPKAQGGRITQNRPAWYLS